MMQFESFYTQHTSLDTQAYFPNKHAKRMELTDKKSFLYYKQLCFFIRYNHSILVSFGARAQQQLLF